MICKIFIILYLLLAMCVGIHVVLYSANGCAWCCPGYDEMPTGRDIEKCDPAHLPTRVNLCLCASRRGVVG